MGLRQPDIYGAVFCASPCAGYRPPALMPSSLPPRTSLPARRSRSSSENAKCGRLVKTDPMVRLAEVVRGAVEARRVSDEEGGERVVCVERWAELRREHFGGDRG
jgi:hypothetical protein